MEQKEHNPKHVELVEKVKQLIIDQVWNSDKPMKQNYSDFISGKIGMNYTHIANVFSDIAGESVQNFTIKTRIERAKSLLFNHNLTLTEISYKLHYSSTAHLSNQFKQVTGMNPTKWVSEERIKERMKSFVPNNNDAGKINLN